MTTKEIKQKLTPYPAVRQPGDKQERQRFRINRILSTRFLDNNFNPELQKNKFWLPNGYYITKKYYEASDSGLCHYFEKNNTLLKNNITPLENIPYYYFHQKGPNRNLDVLKNNSCDLRKGNYNNISNNILKPCLFPEYEFIKKNERIVTIEFCSNCEDHSMHTNHSSESYKNIASYFSKAINLRFPAVKVILKPIDTDIIKDFKKSFKTINKSKIIDEKFKPVRIGAFEIQICTGKNEVKVLHSKLSSGSWPCMNKILSEILRYVPTISFKLQLFNQDNKDKNNDLSNKSYINDLNEHLKNIEIKISQLKIKKIEDLNKLYKKDLSLIINPKTRLDMINTLKFMEISNSTNTEVPKPFTHSFYNNFNILSNYKAKELLFKSNENYDSKNFYSTKNYSENSRYNFSAKKQAFTLNNKSLKTSFPNINNIKRSTIKNSKDDNQYIIKDQNNINNSSLIKSLRGLTIKNYFSDDSGKIETENLPYDSYLIEIIENKNYSQSATIYRSMDLQNIEDTPCISVNRCILLLNQSNSFVSILVTLFDNNKNNNDSSQLNYDVDPKLITMADVYINKCYSFNDSTNTNKFGETINSKNKYNNDEIFNYSDNYNKGNRQKVFENETNKGKYDIVLSPGRYLIEVDKDGYNKYKKEIDIVNGENNILVELSYTKKISFNIEVYDFEKFVPLKNALIKINYSNSNYCTEDISNKDGIVNIKDLKEDDFYSIYCSCKGYYPGYRTYVNNHNFNPEEERKDENNNNLDSNNNNIVIIMVKQSYIVNNNLFLFVSYINLPGNNNLESKFSYSNKVKDYLKIENFQSDKGVLSNLISLDPNYDPENDSEEYGEIIRISMKINNKYPLLKNYEINKKTLLNGLNKYSCECLIYNSNGYFQISPPEFNREIEVSNTSDFYWDIGFLDVKNILFLEIGVINSNLLERTHFFNNWISFLQIIINNNAYKTLFKYFGFEESMLVFNDRIIHEPIFFKCIKNQIFNNSNFSNNYNDEMKENKENFKSADFMLYCCDMFKNVKGLISLNILKKKIASNLKNFRDLKLTSTFNNYSNSINIK